MQTCTTTKLRGCKIPADRLDAEPHFRKRRSSVGRHYTLLIAHRGTHNQEKIMHAKSALAKSCTQNRHARKSGVLQSGRQPRLQARVTRFETHCAPIPFHDRSSKAPSRLTHVLLTRRPHHASHSRGYRPEVHEVQGYLAHKKTLPL